MRKGLKIFKRDYFKDGVSVEDLEKALAEPKKIVELLKEEHRDKSVAIFLTSLRNLAGMNQEELAKKMNDSLNKISLFEDRDFMKMRVGDLKSYCDALGLPFVLAFSDDTGDHAIVLKNRKSKKLKVVK